MTGMKPKVAAFAFGILLATTPALALADSLTSREMQVQQLIAVVATLEAQISALTTGRSLACAVFTSKASVEVGEKFVVAWGSVGAMNPGDDPARTMWPASGAATILLSQAGTFEYSFTFYARGGASETCSTKLLATRAQ